MASIPYDLAHHPTQVVLDLGCTRSIGSRTWIRRFQKYALYHGITTEFSPCNKSFVFVNSGTELWDGRRAYPILPSTKEEFGYYTWTGSRRRQHFMSCFIGLYSSPVEYSTMGHIVLDLTSLTYQPKSRERSARPTKHVTFCSNRKKSQHMQLFHKN